MFNNNAERLIEFSGCQNHRCAYCSHKMILPNGKKYRPFPNSIATKEHVEAWSVSFDDSDSNIVACCNLCNMLRNDMDYKIFLRIVDCMQKDVTFRSNWHTLDAIEIRMLSKVIRTEDMFLTARRCKPTAIKYVDKHAKLQSMLYREPWATFALIAAEEPTYVTGLRSDIASIRAVALHTHLKHKN